MTRQISLLLLVVGLAFAGCEGASGADGADGLPGQNGEPGEKGKPGEKGEPGSDAISTGSITGVVRDASGAALPDVVINSSPVLSEKTTDQDGAFSYIEIPVGAYTLTAKNPSGTTVELMVGVAGGSTTEVVIAFGATPAEATATLQGTVIDSAGDGVDGAMVFVEGYDSITALTASDGTFELAGIPAGFVFLMVEAPSDLLLDGGSRNAIYAGASTTVAGLQVVLSGRPSNAATWVGGNSCAGCHGGMHKDIIDGLNMAVHSRFVTEGTSHMVYPELWPAPGDKVLPTNPTGELLMVQDPSDGEGLVNLALCTVNGRDGTEYLFKFYPEQPNSASLTAAELDCSDLPAASVWIPVSGTIGGEGNWGEGYLDPEHNIADIHPNFGEGKQRYLAKVQDVPYLVDWMNANGVPLNKAKQDYVSYLPVYTVQDGTPDSSTALAAGDFGVPKFWQKGPEHWCSPTNTLSRNCAGCHTTGLEIEYADIVEGETTHKAVVTEFDYIDLNITCERCHGPGSDHAATGDITKIVRPQYLTNKSSNETCGQCHSSHAGKSASPKGIFKYAFDDTYKDTLGNGFFVPGVYDLETFFFNYNQPTTTNTYTEGPFHSWPDQIHGRAHSQELPELLRSAHGNNPYKKIDCASCHDVHSLKGGSAKLMVGDYNFDHAGFADNTLCLACHATQGPFEDILVEDVAALHLDKGGVVTNGGEAVDPESLNIVMVKNRVAKAVANHMQDTAGMGGALYTPDNLEMPTGSCVSCHMPKIGKLFDLNDDGQYHLALDGEGKTAVAEGNVASHVFDIVWPGQSSILKNADPSQGHDYDIMPNSCSRCHDFARISGDLD